MIELTAATANPDKLAEIKAILEPSCHLVARPPDVPEVIEDGDTLEANARLKAHAIRDATGRAAVADDTGLEVDALDGAPGVYSARFAGPSASYADNTAKLLADLDGIPPAGRTARFRTVALVAHVDGTETVAHGVIEGVITESPAGASGFGYDPVFQAIDGDGRTFAQMTDAEKRAISHRGLAFRSLVAQLTTP